MFDVFNYSAESKYYNNSNKLVVGKMKDETGCVANKGLVGLKAKMNSFLVDEKMYSFLVDDSSEHKKSNGVNKNVLATISHDEYKDVLLNKKFLRE